MFPMYAMPQKYEIIHVNGEAGANALQMLPNSQTIVIDDTAPQIFVCVTDGAGYKTVTPFTIAPVKKETPADAVKTLEERIERLERMLRNESTESISAEQE